MVRISVLVVLVAALAVAAPGSAAEQRKIASYCSPSGDVCYGIFDQRGVIRFNITTAAQYFNRYRLCVKPPRAMTKCRSFSVRRKGANYGGSVIWARNFPSRGPGRYRVTWKLGAAQPLGPTLSFRVPPAV